MHVILFSFPLINNALYFFDRICIAETRKKKLRVSAIETTEAIPYLSMFKSGIKKRESLLGFLHFFCYKMNRKKFRKNSKPGRCKSGSIHSSTVNYQVFEKLPCDFRINKLISN